MLERGNSGQFRASRQTYSLGGILAGMSEDEHLLLASQADNLVVHNVVHQLCKRENGRNDEFTPMLEKPNESGNVEMRVKIESNK